MNMNKFHIEHSLIIREDRTRKGINTTFWLNTFRLVPATQSNTTNFHSLIVKLQPNLEPNLKELELGRCLEGVWKVSGWFLEGV